MCRKYEAIGIALITFGAGLLLSIVIASNVWTAVVGVASAVLGCLLTRKR